MNENETRTDGTENNDDAAERRRSRRNWIAAGAGLAVALIAAAALGALIAGGDDSEDEDVPALVISEPEEGVVSQAAQVSEAGPSPAVASTETIDADDIPIEAAEQRRVEAAALAITGGGTVTEMDRSDDAGEAFEVEVLTDAGEVDVALDENLKRVPNLRYDEVDGDDGL